MVCGTHTTEPDTDHGIGNDGFMDAVILANKFFWNKPCYAGCRLNNLFTYEHTGKRKYLDTYREYLPDN